MRSILKQLAQRDIQVRALGATVFGSANGMSLFKQHFSRDRRNRKRIVEFKDGPIAHSTVLTKSINRDLMAAFEEGLWYSEYQRILRDFKPDLVMMFGGQPLDILATHEAQRRGVPVAAYLVNGNYRGSNWCRDVDVILTDSEATRRLYRENEGFESQVIGTYISPKEFVPENVTQDRVLFVNPTMAKGATVVAAVAALLEHSRPDIKFEVVEARGDWKRASRLARRQLRKVSFDLKNVTVTPGTSDMRPVYARAKVLLMPSLWWESGGRVASEAMMNGLPVIATNRGGIPELVGDSGVLVDFPEYCYEAPYTKLPPREILENIATLIERFYDDESFYRSCSTRGRELAAESHDIEKNTDYLISVLKPFLLRRAGDEDFGVKLRDTHKQGELIGRGKDQK